MHGKHWRHSFTHSRTSNKLKIISLRNNHIVADTKLDGYLYHHGCQPFSCSLYVAVHRAYYEFGGLWCNRKNKQIQCVCTSGASFIKPQSHIQHTELHGTMSDTPAINFNAHFEMNPIQIAILAVYKNYFSISLTMNYDFSRVIRISLQFSPSTVLSSLMCVEYCGFCKAMKREKFIWCNIPNWITTCQVSLNRSSLMPAHLNLLNFHAHREQSRVFASMPHARSFATLYMQCALILTHS